MPVSPKVRETISYAARLRLPPGMTRAEKDKHVEQVSNFTYLNLFIQDGRGY
jgi:hypothetical protein